MMTGPELLCGVPCNGERSFLSFPVQTDLESLDADTGSTVWRQSFAADLPPGSRR